jgi:hypothetical protein
VFLLTTEKKPKVPQNCTEIFKLLIYYHSLTDQLVFTAMHSDFLQHLMLESNHNAYLVPSNETTDTFKEFVSP